ncbi:MAG TPA: CARDB domain-containing protein, partial [Thermoanaerobaculia bacterium]|nr:CARDB domain-containing protein [Thermoanaerobaculia bacterium]
WTELATDLAAPWETTFDPLAFDPDLAHGAYELRPVATDQAGATDPSPAAITVTYADLTAPAAPLGLATHVDGGDVDLTWTASPESDLRGYHVERQVAGGTKVRLTASPLATATYRDANVADGKYEYTVLAIDQAGNESPASATAPALVVTPTLEQPFMPTRATAADLAGSSAYVGTAAGEIGNSGGTTAIPPIATTADGAFGWSGLAVAQGDNSLRARVTDAATNRTKFAAVAVTVGTPPSAPTGVVAAPGSGTHDVAVHWNANPEPNVLGYRPWRDGVSLLAERTVDDATATASSSVEFAAPYKAIDGNLGTYWAPQLDAHSPFAGQTFEVSWSTARLVREVDLTWISEGSVVYAPADFDLQARYGGVWVPVRKLRANVAATQQWQPADLYPTDRLRIVLHAPIQGASVDTPVRLAELRIVHQPIQTATTLTETVPDGLHEYLVTAVNALGFESAPSAAATIAVGDATPPDPVVLTATVSGADVHLAWTASTAPDLQRYDVYRDGARIGQRTDLADRTWRDAARPNGTYRYVVRAVDQVGNTSLPSNEEVVTIAVAAPTPPSGLVVTAVSGGGALDLAWQAPTGPAPAAYRVFRALAAGGPYQPIGESTTTGFRNSGLTNGTTYYYVVTARDAAGNESGPSNEASGTPRDEAPPPAPVLTFPAFHGVPRLTRVSPTLVTGFAAPGAEVQVRRNGSFAGETVALATAEQKSIFAEEASAAALAPDGRLLWLRTDAGFELHDLDTGGTTAVAQVSGSVRWEETGRFSYFATGHSIQRHDATTGAVEEVATADVIKDAAPSPDGLHLAVAAQRGDDSGIWLFDLTTRGWSLLLPLDSAYDVVGTLLWSPTGSHIAYLRFGSGYPLELVEVASGHATRGPSSNGEPPSWAPDGSALVWTSTSSGSEQVWRYEVATGTTQRLTGEPGAHRSAQWSPEGTAIAYVEDHEKVLRLDLGSGAHETLPLVAGDGIRDLSWLDGGQLLVWRGSDVVRLTPTGRFAVPAVGLVGGDNRFDAIARDAAGNASPPAAETIAHLLSDSLPNLAVLPADVAVLPAVPLAGSVARLSVVVRNLGGAPAPATDLTVAVAGPNGFSATLASATAVPALAPGGAVTFGFDLTLPTAGSYTIAARVDGRGAIAEPDETD